MPDTTDREKSPTGSANRETGTSQNAVADLKRIMREALEDKSPEVRESMERILNKFPDKLPGFLTAKRVPKEPRPQRDWVDPICYQFSFLTICREDRLPALQEVYSHLAEDLRPVWEQFFSDGSILQVVLMEYMKNQFQLVYADKDAWNDLMSRLPEIFAKCGTVTAEPKSPGQYKRYFVSTRKIDPQWRKLVERVTVLDPDSGEAEQEWWHTMLNCPTDDLRGVYFPKRTMPGGEPLPLALRMYVYPLRKEKPTDARYAEEWGIQLPETNDHGAYFVHHLQARVPRCILDRLEEPLRLQAQWKRYLDGLIKAYPASVGTLKMDVYSTNSNTFSAMSGTLLTGLRHHMPDCCWGMYITMDQLKLLGGMENLRQKQLFHSIEQVGDHHVYLQLTPEMEIVPAAKARALWQLVSPHLDAYRHYIWRALYSPPCSFRLGADEDSYFRNERGDLCLRIGQAMDGKE